MDARRQAVRDVRAHSDLIVRAALDRQRERWPGLFDSFSPSQMENTVKDTGYHVRFLATALWTDEQIIFDDYVDWARVLFENLHIPVEWLTGSLTDIREALPVVVPPNAAREAATVIDAALPRIAVRGDEMPTNVAPGAPLAELAMRYLSAVLGGDRADALQAVLSAAEDGVPIVDLYRHVLEPAQLELGRLWHMNAITVAQEHYATAVTQMVMAQLYRFMFTGQHTDGVLVAACVGDELHELGMRMVADHFEMAGWDTHFVGASTPVQAIVDLAAKRDADVVALSATIIRHTGRLRRTVAAQQRTDGAPARTRPQERRARTQPTSREQHHRYRAHADLHPRPDDAAHRVR